MTKNQEKLECWFAKKTFCCALNFKINQTVNCVGINIKKSALEYILLVKI